MHADQHTGCGQLGIWWSLGVQGWDRAINPRGPVWDHERPRCWTQLLSTPACWVPWFRGSGCRFEPHRVEISEHGPGGVCLCPCAPGCLHGNPGGLMVWRVAVRWGNSSVILWKISSGGSRSAQWSAGGSVLWWALVGRAECWCGRKLIALPQIPWPPQCGSP